ncbi:MAG: CDP-alcohol phosphatidyltransferase family protein, partial [Candidatus Omnitrophica bacterium]|nr:CDP-alcohol phosphatidyltransferase family protein [Candidatus Omnitrophota bacterium]
MPMTFANIMTVVRILSVPFFISSVVYYHPEQDYIRYITFAIFAFAVFTDLVDGYFARAYHENTKIGAILDPLADKFLLMSAFICLFIVKDVTAPIEIPLWILLIVISRDAILLVGGAAIYLVCGNIDIQPTRIGKMTAFFQVISIMAALLRLPVFPALWLIVGLLSIVSGADYLMSGAKAFNDHS